MEVIPRKLYICVNINNGADLPSPPKIWKSLHFILERVTGLVLQLLGGRG